ncbi:MAG: lipopolysaccharide biosynthesis protein, partial [Desulfobacterales bacterium]|nr:lipopolysaccharide biosynthesis protein [Desulfobacterales bacterium]
MSENSRALTRGAAARTAELLAGMVSAVVVVPLLVHHAGPRDYGLWILSGTLLGYYGLLDLGVSSAVQRFVSRALGARDTAAADAFLVAGLYLFLGAGIAVLLLTLTVFALGSAFLPDSDESSTMLQLVLISGWAMALSFPSRCLRGVLAAHLRFDLLSMMVTLATVIRTGLLAAILLLGGDIVGVAWSAAAVEVILALAITLAGLRVQRPARLGPAGLRAPVLRELAGYASYTFMAQLTDLMRFNVMPFLVLIFLGLPAVAVYGIADRLRRMCGHWVSAFMSMMTPVFSRQDGAGDTVGLRDTYRFAYRMSCFAGTFIAGPVLLFGDTLVEAWLGAGQGEVALLLKVFMIGTFCALLQTPAVNLLYGTSRNRFYALTNLLQAVLTLLLALLLLRPYGLLGVVAATSVVSCSVKIGVQAWGAAQVLGLSLFRYHWELTLPNVAPPLLLLLLIVPLLDLLATPDPVRLAAVGLGTGGV